MGTTAAVPARLTPPGKDPEEVAARIMRRLVRGREGDRNQADREVTEASDEVCVVLRRRVLEFIDSGFRPGGALTRESWDTRNKITWLLYVLGRICDDDAAAVAVVSRHLDAQQQPNEWIRFWALAGLARSRRDDLASFARNCSGDASPVVRMLSWAMLTNAGDIAARDDLRKALESQDATVLWAALRALRITGADDLVLVQRVCEIVGRGDNDNITYDAIKAAYHVPLESEGVRDATHALIQFVVRWRSFPGRDSMRAIALIGLGKLRAVAGAPVLVEELTDDNPAIVRQAARSLEAILTTRVAVSRVLEAAHADDPERLPAYADALRQMKDREAVATELSAAMMAGTADQQERSRRLLSEMGGIEALQKLRARSDLMSQYTKFLAEAEEKIQNLFNSSVEEARGGFRLALYMDIAVFVLGFALIGVSAALQLRAQGELTTWVGAAASGVTGVLGILYSLLIAKPRKQVTREVDHLMALKVLFLGYLRQLHQSDQAYVRRILEDKAIDKEELAGFAGQVEESMKAALLSLKDLKDSVES